MVFIFFGIVATVGTVYLQTDVQTQEAWVTGAGVGFFAVAVLVINNVRDIPTDRLAGKRTLAVRMGDRASRALYIVCVLLPFAVPALYGFVNPGMVLVWFVLLIVAPCVLIAITAKTPRELILVLQLTSLAARSPSEAFSPLRLPGRSLLARPLGDAHVEREVDGGLAEEQPTRCLGRGPHGVCDGLSLLGRGVHDDLVVQEEDEVRAVLEDRP
jgi:hypothetical protein